MFLVITLIIIITTVIEMFAADISVSGLRCTEMCIFEPQLIQM